MRDAYHPVNNLLITIDLYWLEFGRKPLLSIDNRARARCPICNQSLHDVGGRSESSTGHFSHYHNSGYCPTKTSAAMPFNVLAPTRPDPKHSLYLRTQFFEKWEWHYSLMGQLAPFLSYQEFIALIKEANRLNIWGYANLRVEELPYTLMLLTDFPVKTSYKKNGVSARKYWLRFFYDPNVRSLEELWIHRSEIPEFFCAAYNEPKLSGQIPGFLDMVNLKSLKRDESFLSKQAPPIANWLKSKLDSELPPLLKIKH